MIDEDILELNEFIYSLDDENIVLYLRELYEEALDLYSKDKEPLVENIKIIKAILVYKIFKNGFKSKYFDYNKYLDNKYLN